MSEAPAAGAGGDGADAPVVPLPMFPLGTVLFPFAPLSLHIFEPRYRALAQDCVRGNGEFGVVLIERGFEVGGGDTRFGTGTVAHLVEAVELPDGRWLLTAVGTRRFRVATWIPDDPYPLALVQDLSEPEPAFTSDGVHARPGRTRRAPGPGPQGRARRASRARHRGTRRRSAPACVPVGGHRTSRAHRSAALARAARPK